MADSDIDALFTRDHGGAVSWYDQLDDEQRAWFDKVIDASRERSREPVAKKVAVAFAERFGVREPAESTIRDHLRRRL